MTKPLQNSEIQSVNVREARGARQAFYNVTQQT
jgi:hypothetical protein